MASYDIAQYLLDRANIHDTVTKVVCVQCLPPFSLSF